MFEQIVEVLKDFVEVSAEQITEKSNLISDLGLNSLDVVNVVMAFEEKFGIEIPDEDIMKLVTVEDIVEYLSGYVWMLLHGRCNSRGNREADPPGG